MFSINHSNYNVFVECANQIGWVASRKPRSWAIGIGANELFVSELRNEVATREYLKELCGDSAVAPETCFLAIMAWGGMKYSHGRLAWNLRHEWKDIVEDLRCGLLSRQDAFERFQRFRNLNRGCGIGPAFYTKLIFFGSPYHDGYIMDQWTSLSINLILNYKKVEIVKLVKGVSGGRLSYTVSDRNNSDTFEIFCQGIEFLSYQISDEEKKKIIIPEDIEMKMFSVGGRNPAPWRQYVRDKS